MKGTIDATLPHAESILLDDAKEAAEHATIVDLIRNDLSMVSEHVTVASYRYIDRLQTNKGPILQTSSEICGMLPGDYTKRLGDILFKLLPAGSITGAPKPRTMQIIAEAEGYERGFYTGVMGCYADGRLDSAVMIRFIEQEDGQLYFKAGGWHHRPKPLGKQIQRSNTENICPFIETIRVRICGEVRNTAYHERRMNNTVRTSGLKAPLCNWPATCPPFPEAAYTSCV